MGAQLLITCTVIGTFVGAVGLLLTGRNLELALRSQRQTEKERARQEVRDQLAPRLEELREDRDYWRGEVRRLEAEIRHPRGDDRT